MPESGIPQRIKARREARRRRLKRQRTLAASGLLAVACITGLALAGALSSVEDPALDGPLATGSPADTRAAAGSVGSDESSSEAAGESSDGTGSEGEPGLLRNAATQPGWRRHTGPVPMLMYHVLDEPAPGAPFPDLYLAADDFRAQIDWLAAEGYEAVTLRQVEHAWWHDGRLPEKPIVLSFDDGYVSHYETAFPALAEHGWPGLLNLKAGETDIYKRQVREMLAAGWELGSHTVNHPDLTSLDATSLADELTRSRRVLRRRFGVAVTHLCYPAGRFNDTVVAAAEAAGYTTAATTEPGLAGADDPYRLRRIRVNRGDGPAALAAALSSLRGS